MAWHKGKQINLIDSQQITTWRQVLTKENSLYKGKTLKELEALKDELDRKNTYMHLFKNDDKVKRETIAEKTGKNTVFVYDQAKRDEEAHDGYCQKCRRESVWCKDRHPRELPQKDYSSVVTTS
jgi:hypothetical protein